MEAETWTRRHAHGPLRSRRRRQSLSSAAGIVRFFFTTQTQVVTRCILYQIKGMNLRNMNIGDDNVVNWDKIGQLTLYVPWCKISQKTHRQRIIDFQINQSAHAIYHISDN